MKRTLIAVLVLLAVAGFGIQNATAFLSHNYCNPYCKTICYRVDYDQVPVRDGRDLPRYLKLYTGCDFLQYKTEAYDVRGLIWLGQPGPVSGSPAAILGSSPLRLSSPLEDGEWYLTSTVVVDGTLQSAPGDGDQMLSAESTAVDGIWALFLSGPNCVDLPADYVLFYGCPTSSCGNVQSVEGVTLEPISCWKLPDQLPPKHCDLPAQTD